MANPILGTASTTNPFPLVFSTDPMPALPYLPAMGGSPLNVVVLHYLNCANLTD